MNFAQPLWLVAGVAAAGALWLLARAARRGNDKALSRLVATRLRGDLTRANSPGRRRLKLGLLMAGTFLVFAAVARPQVGYTYEEAQQRGIDILFAIDTSRSMLAQDLAPDRLTRAKLAVEDLIRTFPADRVGLVAFAGDAFLQAPMTLDRAIFTQALMALDTTIIPRGGSDLARAISVAREALRSQPGHEKLLVLLTDGEDLEGGALDAAEAAATDGITIHTVGIGSADGGPIPVADARGGVSPLRDASGQVVVSRLDEATLRAVAAATGGRYEALGADGRGLDRLYTSALEPLPKQILSERRARVPIERFQWPLALGLLLLALEPTLGERARRRRRRGAKPATAAAAALMIATLAAPGSARAASSGDAAEAFARGDYGQAAELYEHGLDDEAQDPVLLYNAATARYEAGDYETAVDQLETAIAAGSQDIVGRGAYNLGNAYYRRGAALLEQDKAQTRTLWEQSLLAYEAAQRDAPDDVDARHNWEFVKHKLDELDHQPPPQEPKDTCDDPQAGDDDQPKDDQSEGDTGDPNDDRSDTGEGDPKSNANEGGQGDPKDERAADNGDPADQGDPEGDPKDDPATGGQPQPEAADSGAQPGGGAPAAPSPDLERAAPGRLNRAEARALLDALEEGDGKLELLPVYQGRPGAPPQTPPSKDW